MTWDGRIRADARHLPISDASVQCIVTSPPYWGLRDYGQDGQIGLERTPHEYVSTTRGVAAELWRVLRADGTLWLNLGDCYNAYNGGAGPSSSISRGASTTERPKLETGYGLRTKGLKPKDLVGIPWRVAFALQADGWYLRSDIIWAKRNCMPESVTDRPTRSHEYIFLLTKSERYFYDAAAIAEPCAYGHEAKYDPGTNGMQGGESHAGSGASTRRFKTSGNKERKFRGDFGGTDLAGSHQGFGVPWEGLTRNKRDVWHVGTAPYPEAHYATFPPDLVEPCILAGSRPGDVVLDPFFGSGTVGMVAEKLNRRWIGTDLGYQDLQAKRLKNVQKELLGVR